MLQALRDKDVRLDIFAARGLLSMCLRCLSCADPALRALAYEALGLYSAQLSTPEEGSLYFRRAKPHLVNLGSLKNIASWISGLYSFSPFPYNIGLTHFLVLLNSIDA